MIHARQIGDMIESYLSIHPKLVHKNQFLVRHLLSRPVYYGKYTNSLDAHEPSGHFAPIFCICN
jgi:hypothetical protein